MYNKAIHPLYVTEEDVTTARLHSTIEALFIAGRLCAEWVRQIKALEIPVQHIPFNEHCMLAMLFEVGRMQGIREERARQKQKPQTLREVIKDERSNKKN
jgi:hypothetical protein